MTAPASSTASPTTPSKSRRAVLAGALGGLGAWAASAVGRASPVRAEGETMVVGGEYSTAQSVTRIRNEANDADVFLAQSTGAGVGVIGTSSSDVGVFGISTSNAGVRGFSNSGSGVTGEATGDQASVYGSKAANGHAVLGEVSAAGSGWAATVGRTNGTGAGVFGINDGNTGPGVLGRSDLAHGVRGVSTSGVGLYGQATSGLALQTAGRTKLSTSGVATISAGSSSKVVDPGVNVTAGSFVLLTPKANIGSRALWFTTNATANTFTIRMSSSRSSGTKVAWLLLG